MIVWSKGLGKQRLPIELKDSELSRAPEHLMLKGIIEPVFWEYSIKLSPQDLVAFLKLLTHRETITYLAEHKGILMPFLLRLISILPGLICKVVFEKTVGRFRRQEAV
ncbi:MAG: hypothetical protein M0Q95_02035 [Porticoccaceae bacterium]|jgi:hypothetical protein|nr:hypothetical protein [Porticoccaceae bacterium]